MVKQVLTTKGKVAVGTMVAGDVAIWASIPVFVFFGPVKGLITAAVGCVTLGTGVAYAIHLTATGQGEKVVDA